MDEKAWKPILDWLGGNWGWVIAALGVFFEIGCVGFEATRKWVQPQEKGG